jgi:hypothetical protein
MKKEKKLKRCLISIPVELRNRLVRTNLPTRAYNLQAKISFLLSYWEKHSLESKILEIREIAELLPILKNLFISWPYKHF